MLLTGFILSLSGVLAKKYLLDVVEADSRKDGGKGEDFTLNIQGNVKRSKIYHACKEDFNIEGKVEDSYLKASPINAGEDYLTVAVACKGDAEIQGDLNDVNIVHADFDQFTGPPVGSIPSTIHLKPNQWIFLLPFLGPNYKITFQFQLLGNGDGNLLNLEAYNFSPLRVNVLKGKLRITNGLNGISWKSLKSITPKKWYHVEILQKEQVLHNFEEIYSSKRLRNRNQDKYFLKINGKRVLIEDTAKSRKIKGVNVFATREDEVAANAQIENFLVDTHDRDSQRIESSQK